MPTRVSISINVQRFLIFTNLTYERCNFINIKVWHKNIKWLNSFVNYVTGVKMKIWAFFYEWKFEPYSKERKLLVNVKVWKLMGKLYTSPEQRI